MFASSMIVRGATRVCRTLIAAMVMLTVLVPCGHGKEPPRTPLEVAEYKRLSTSAEISAYLERLAFTYPRARVETIGTTVQGRPMQALVMTGVPGADAATANRLTIEIVGSQHGTESAGAESLLFVARDLLAGTMRHVLDDVDVVLVPNANPDGRELGKRANANAINLNIDFVALTQPESRALIAALQRYRPEVTLDVHESGILKRKSLALEGYMTDFTAQFEIANNPNVVPALHTFAMSEALVPWIAGVNAAGLKSHRYFGEIKSSRQNVTNGGLTLRNLRNRSAMEGSLSFLMETRLDPREGEYPTFRNIGARVTMQRISIERFLKLLHGKRKQALRAVAAAKPQAASAPLVLDAEYVPKAGSPEVSIDLRRIKDGKLERIEFADHRRVEASGVVPMPAGYIVREHQGEIGALLERHGIVYRTLDATRKQRAVEFQTGPPSKSAEATFDRVRERAVRLRAAPGDLWVDVDQRRGRLAALLLEPRSASSLFLTPKYYALVEGEKVLPVYRVPR